MDETEFLEVDIKEKTSNKGGGALCRLPFLPTRPNRRPYLKYTTRDTSYSYQFREKKRNNDSENRGNGSDARGGYGRESVASFRRGRPWTSTLTRSSRMSLCLSASALPSRDGCSLRGGGNCGFICNTIAVNNLLNQIKQCPPHPFF